MPPFIACAMPNILPTVAPAPAPTLPCAGACVDAASQAAKPACASGRTRASPSQRSNSTAAGTIGTRAGPIGKAVAVLVEPAHHAAGGIEAERAAAGQQQRVHLVDEVARHQQIGLARAGCRAAHVDAAGDAGFAQHHRAAGGPARVGVVADLQAGDVGRIDLLGLRRAHANTPACRSCAR